MAKRKQGTNKWHWILIGGLAAILLTVVALNFFSPGSKTLLELKHEYGVADPQFRRSVGTLMGPSLLDGNRVTTLLNGDQMFPAMLAAIRSARSTITMETYIYWGGAVGRQFADVLSEKARAGVHVHLLVDWLGSGKMDKDLLQEMRDAGVEVEKYRPLHWYTLSRLNNRTHRKLLIVDGRIGFTGGAGIADIWLGHAQDKDHWRDTHFQLEGPAVAEMQAAFLDNWVKTRAVVLHGDGYFPELQPAGDQVAQVFKSSARDGSESAHLLYLLSIASAEKSILLSSAYFVPDDVAIAELVAARRRGVRVEIITPGKSTDTKVTRNASRSRWGDLLEAGVEFYEYQPTMYHVKVMIVDGVWTSVGSTNFDPRSFRLNDEANLNVFDSAFARRQTEVFEDDRSHSRRVTLEMWRHRPRSEKFKEWLAGLLRSQL